MLAVGALASRFVLELAPHRIATDLAQPLVVATNWGPYGALLWLVLAASLALGFIAYLHWLGGEPPTRPQLFLAVSLSLVAGFAWAPLFSSDVYAYSAYGEMARTGIDPYIRLSLPSHDPIVAAAQWQWGGTFPLCVYGSVFVRLAQVVVTLTGATHVLLALDAMRIVASIAFLVCTLLLYTLSPRAATFFALNPIALWSAIEGHNDTIALAIVLLGIAVSRRWSVLGSAIVALAALVKLPAFGASIALATDAVITRVRTLPILTGTVAGIALVAAGSVALVSGVRGDLVPHGHYEPLASVQTLGIPVAILAAAIALVRLRAFANRIDRWCVVAFALWIAIPNPYPWYSLWLLAPSGFASDPRVRNTAIALSAASLLRYVPDAASVPTGFASISLGLCALAAFIPLVL